MSKQKNQKLGIVKAIMAIFKSGDEAKLSSFFGKVEKSIKDQKKTVEANYAQSKLVADNELEELKDQLIDAKEQYQDTFTSIDMSQIQTKDSQRNYVDIYMNSLKMAEIKVERLESDVKVKEEEIKDLRDTKNRKLKSLDDKLSKIQSEFDISHLVEQE